MIRLFLLKIRLLNFCSTPMWNQVNEYFTNFILLISQNWYLAVRIWQKVKRSFYTFELSFNLIWKNQTKKSNSLRMCCGQTVRKISTSFHQWPFFFLAKRLTPSLFPRREKTEETWRILSACFYSWAPHRHSFV